MQNALEEVLTDWGAEWVGTGKSFDPQGGVCKSPSLVACTAGRKAAVDISAGKVVWGDVQVHCSCPVPCGPTSTGLNNEP